MLNKLIMKCHLYRVKLQQLTIFLIAVVKKYMACELLIRIFRNLLIVVAFVIAVILVMAVHVLFSR